MASRPRDQSLNKQMTNTPLINPWYKNGLPFQCQGCGRCCTGAPGYVWLSKEDEQRILDHLKISIETFRTLYTREINGMISLKENYHNYDCIFFKDKGCSIYQSRPIQCRTFPFWKSNLESFRSYQEATKNCPGVRVSSPIISCPEIEKRAQENLF